MNKYYSCITFIYQSNPTNIFFCNVLFRVNITTCYKSTYVKTHFIFTQDCWFIDYAHLILICYQEILEGFERQGNFAYHQRRDKSGWVSGAESHCCQVHSQIHQSARQGSRNSRYTCWVETETLKLVRAFSAVANFHRVLALFLNTHVTFYAVIWCISITFHFAVLKIQFLAFLFLLGLNF
jgi:hypothetical protein